MGRRMAWSKSTTNKQECCTFVSLSSIKPRVPKYLTIIGGMLMNLFIDISVWETALASVLPRSGARSRYPFRWDVLNIHFSQEVNCYVLIKLLNMIPPSIMKILHLKRI